MRKCETVFTRALRPQPILIDADPAITVRTGLDVDDDLAILFALGSPELEVRAVTTTYGNAPCHRTFRDAEKLLSLAKRKDIPLAKGAGWLSRNIEARTDASRLIVEQVLRSDGELVIVTLGPLTNFAQALRAEPSIASRIKGHLAMGGRMFGGLELNFSAHPEATRVVLEAPIPRVAVTLEACLGVAFTSKDLEAVIAEPDAVVSRFSGRLKRFLWANRVLMPAVFRGFEGHAAGGFHPWDIIALAYLVRPDLFFPSKHLRIEMRGRRMVCSKQEGTGWSNAVLAPRGVEARPFLDLMIERILRVRLG